MHRSTLSPLTAAVAALIVAVGLLPGAPASAEEVKAEGAERSQAAVLGSLTLLMEDQDFELDRACLRNVGPEGTWHDPAFNLGFGLSHDLAVLPQPGDIKVQAAPGLKVVKVDIQQRAVVIMLSLDGESYTFHENELTCIDLSGFDYVGTLPHGWTHGGPLPGRAPAGE